jgi:hypothetical protein
MVAMLALGVVMLAMAGIAGYGYVDTKRRVDAIESREPVSPDRVAEGPTIVEGTVAPADVEPLQAPLTGRDAVLVEWEREEDPDDEDTGATSTGQHAVDFVLEDQGGRVRVRPASTDAVTVSGAARTSEHVYDTGMPDEELLARLDAFDEDVRDDDPGFHRRSSEKIGHGMRRLSTDVRLVEEVLAPGDTVTVVGEVSRDANGGYVVEDGGDGPFLLSDMGTDALRDTYAGNQTLLLGVLVVLLGVAGYGFASFLGVL